MVRQAGLAGRPHNLRLYLWALLAGVGILPVQAAAEIDLDRYMPSSEVRRGMKGYGKTVISGTEIKTFDLEVISVMHNSWYAKQDVILVRCSGLNLEHSGIVGGMSGSPCYIRDDAGRERMIGAVAYGWSFNKDPVCGVQPINQMLEVGVSRDPAKRPATQPAAGLEGGVSMGGRGVSPGEIMQRVWGQPIDAASRFSLFNSEVGTGSPKPAATEMSEYGLTPLRTPVMVSGIHPRRLSVVQERFDRLGMTLLASGGAGEAERAAGRDMPFQPGGVLCIPLLTGDMNFEALGTCTEVVGDKVYGFGHSLFGRGFVELPLATGMVHTVISSVLRSNKMGAAYEPIGTLWGDETSAVFGITGSVPRTSPIEVALHDIRGDQVYRYQLSPDPGIGAMILTTAVAESIFAHNDLPEDHVIRYNVQIDFGDLGSFKTSNFTSQVGTAGIENDVLVPAMVMNNTPFGDYRVSGARMAVSIEPQPRAARVDRVRLPRSTFKPGETVEVQVRWFHNRRSPSYSDSAYQFSLPADLPDGAYDLIVGDASSHLAALKQEKPFLWRAENAAQMLSTLNLAGAVPENRLYLHLVLQADGMAIGRMELPELPSFRQKILIDAKRTDVEAFRESLLVTYDVDFMVRGAHTVKIHVQRRTES